MASIRLKDLEQYLQDVEGFEDPNIDLEQYVTTSHIAAHMLYSIESRFGDISGKMVADLGCGTGMLSIGAALLGCGLCVGIEIDDKALEICRRNVESTELELPIELVQMDIRSQVSVGQLADRFDTVIMNPPFGTRQKGADTEFLIYALNMSKSNVYSLHKSSTVQSFTKIQTLVVSLFGRFRNWYWTQHFVRMAKSLNVSCEVVAEVNYNLDKTYKFQRRDTKDISVSLLCFSRQDSSKLRTLEKTLDTSLTLKDKQNVKHHKRK